MYHTKKNIIFIFIIYYKIIFSKTLEECNVLENCTFNKSTIITNNSIINGCNINGQIFFNNINQENVLKFSLNKKYNFQFYIYNLPFLEIIDDKISFIMIDDKDKLFILEDFASNINNNINKFNTINNLNAINIDLLSLNNFENNLVISSTNQNKNPITINIGNQNSNIIFISDILLNINNIIFNNSINSPINITNFVTAEKNIFSKSIIINKSLIINNNTNINFLNTYVNNNLNINSNNNVIFQGNILFNTDLQIGNLNTNLYLFSEYNNTEIPIYFLGIDNNKNLCASTIYPELSIIKTNQIKSENNLKIISNNNMQIGNYDSNIFFEIDTLLINGNITTTNNKKINFIFNNKNYFKQSVVFNALNTTDCLISNDINNITAPAILKRITFHGPIYFNNLPILKDIKGYLILNNQNNISFLSVISIDESLKQYKNIENQFYKNNQKIYSNIKTLEEDINYIKKLNFKKKYYITIKLNHKFKKKLLFYLKKIKNKINHNKIKQKLIKIQESLNEQLY